jgi:hypothetical protein
MTNSAKHAGLLAFVVAVVVAANAPLLATSTVNVPEISASSISAGMGLLTAGVLILRARRRSK